jgi:hypothetical protein
MANQLATSNSVSTNPEIFTSGNLTTDLATITAAISRYTALGSNYSLIINTLTTLGASSVTIPSTVKLVFKGGGIINFSASQSLTIAGSISAEIVKIFNYADSTCQVTFTKKTTLYPEWWGAIGDESNNDTTAFQYMFKSPSELWAGNRVELTSGKHYKISDQLELWSSSFAHSQWHIYGNGAQIRVTSLGTNKSIFKIGNSTLGDFRVHELILDGIIFYGSVGATAGTSAININNSSFGRISNCTIAGFETGILADGYGGNGWMFDNINMSGCDVACCDLGPSVIPSFGSFNTWTWTGGKLQGSQYGFNIQGATFTIDNVDCSLLSVAALNGYALSEGRIKLYSESIGTDTIPNNASVMILDSCANLTIIGCRINGAAATAGSSKNSKYGIQLLNCRQMTITDNIFTLHQVADIYIDSNSEGETIVITQTNGHELDSIKDARVKISDNTVTGVKNLLNANSINLNQLTPLIQNVDNVIQNPNDFSTSEWTKTNVTISTSTVLAPDGISQAQILNFPNTDYAGDTLNLSSLSLSTTHSFGYAMNGRVMVLRYWVKPISVLNASSFNLHRFRSEFQREAGDLDYWDTDGCYDGYDQWVFVERKIAPPNASLGNPSKLYNLRFLPGNSAGDGISVALWGVQVFSVPSYHGTSGLEIAARPMIADTRTLLDLTAGTSSRDVASIPDPTDTPATADALRDDLVTNILPVIRNNFATLTKEYKNLKSILRQASIVRTIDPRRISASTLWLDPDRAVDTPIDNTPVSYLCNLAAKGNGFSATGSNRPVYKTNQINGHGVLEFTAASSQKLTSTYTIGDIITAAKDAMFLILNPSSISSDSATSYSNVGTLVDANNGYRGIYLRSSLKVVSEIYDAGDWKVEQSFSGLSTPFLVTVYHDGTTQKVSVNGGAWATAAVIGDGNNDGALAGSSWQIGQGAGGYFNGQMGEIITLNDVNLDTVYLLQEYLIEKWGLG